MQPDQDERLRELLEGRRWHPLRHLLADLHAADVAELVGGLSEAEQDIVLRLLGRRKSEVFAYLPTEIQERTLEEISPLELDELVAAMSPDDRTRLLELMPTEMGHAVLSRLPHS